MTATLTVTPGEQLQVGVGAVGGAGPCGQNSGGAGGTGGGGAGGNAASGSGVAASGAGGGGASTLARPVVSPGFSSLLVVAGAGGGAGGPSGGNGGNADAPGATAGGFGGGSGDSTAGGPPGGPQTCTGAVAGTAGASALGGAGGAGTNATTGGSGGGGGGAGYFGGGGGGGACLPSSAGGGGGGSSFVAQGVLTATPTAAAASVAITYAVPTADLSTQAIVFAGTQPQGIASSEQLVTVGNTGSAPLIVDGVSLSGADPGDYLVSDRCRSPVAPGASCVVGVRFDPHAQGASSAALTLHTNAVSQPAVVAISGTGGPLTAGRDRPDGRRRARRAPLAPRV